MSPLDSRGRILLHLKKYHEFQSKMEVPHDVTQPGIADSVGLSRGHITQVINEMEDKQLVLEEIRHVKGNVRKRKVYFLSSKGLQKERNLREDLEEKTVKLKTDEKTQEIQLKHIGEYIDGACPLLDAVKSIDSNGVLDLSRETYDEEVFIGREKEFLRLKEELNKVENGSSSTIFIIGEAGVGKTRLANELGDHAKDNGFQFFSGKAHFETSDPYLPFKRAFRKFFKKSETTPDFGFGVNMISMHGSKVENRDAFDARRKASFFEAAKELKKLAEDKPVLLFLDDMQWADRASLQLLYYLSLNLEEAPVLLLTAYRPEEVNNGHFLKEIKNRLIREDRSLFIKLEPFDASLTKKMVKTIINYDTPPSKFMDLLYKLTNGNPLYVKEFLRRMVEEGTIDPIKGVYPLTESDFRIPKMIQGVVKRKIDSLPSEASKLLQLGSIIGDEIPFDLLLEASQLNEIDILDQIDVLLGSKLWVEDQEGDRFLFTHQSVQLTSYRNMGRHRRRRLHKYVAKKIEKVYEENLKYCYPKLAYHYEHSGEIEKAVVNYMDAGREAEKVYALEDAIEMYEKCLELTDEESSGIDEIEIYEHLGDIHKILGDYKDSRLNYQKVITSSESTKNISRSYRKIATTWLKQGEFRKTHRSIEKGLSKVKEGSKENCKLLNIKGWALMQEGKNDKAKQVFLEAEEMADKKGCLDSKGDALHNLGTINIRLGEYKIGQKNLEEATRIREKSGDEEGLARSLNNLGIIYEDWGELDKALEAYEKSLSVQKKIGMKEGIATVYVNMGILQGIKGNNTEAEDLFEKSHDMFKRIGDKRGIALSLSNLGKLHIRKGMIERSLELNKKCKELSNKIGYKRAVAMSLNHMGEAYHLLGDLDKAKKHYEKSRKMCEDMGDTRGVASARGNIGDVHLERGDYSKALQEYDRCIDIYEDIGDLFETVHNETRKADVYNLKGNYGSALEHAEKAISLAETKNNELVMAEAYSVSGKIKREGGDLEEAEKDLIEAKKRFSKLNNRPEMACTRYELGILALKKGERERALKILEDVRDDFQEMEMVSMVKLCDDQIDEL